MTATPSFKEKKVALLGFGVESKALLPYLQKEGALVTILDKNEALADHLPDVPAILGPEYLNRLQDFEVVFRSPGIRSLTREIQEARKAGVQISSQTQLFLERCPGTVIGITGTKGKSTTSALIAAMLKQAKANGDISGEVHLAGNIGTPMISLLDTMQSHDYAVIELSSFQLQDVSHSPDIAVVLNITVEHLDYHKDEAEYISAKKNIVRFQEPSDFLVANLDSVTSMLFADETPAQTYFYSREKSVDQGAFIQAQLGDDELELRLPGHSEQTICPVKDIRLIGPYNQENVLAAVVAAALAGAKVPSIRKATTTFGGLKHRLEIVTDKHRIRYIDDSKSTTPDSTIAALLSFDDPITLIVGGSEKGADFTELVQQIIASSVTNVVCIGREGERISQLLSEQNAPQTVLPGGSTMVEIVAQATALTDPGGIVLLSPAAASFDMFKSAEDRGDQFQAAVKAL